LGLLGRTSLVFGTGNPDADILFVGKVPGKNEDEQGVPFAGQSGKLITEMMLKSGTRREDVFITNIVKCRPPNNRAPLL
jgi:DNA polymerase